MSVIVERSKEFVDRLKGERIGGNACFNLFQQAHEVKRILELKEDGIALTYHVLDQCQERLINTDIRAELKKGYIIRGRVREDGQPYLALENDNERTRFVVKLEDGVVIFITACIREHISPCPTHKLSSTYY